MRGKAISTCHMCRRRVDGQENFCYGCQVHICSRCDVNACTGKHVPIDHVRQLPGEYLGGDR
jgi:hypothetical protein